MPQHPLFISFSFYLLIFHGSKKKIQQEQGFYGPKYMYATMIDTYQKLFTRM